MLATSLGPAFAADDVLAAYRLRWQIELAFKRLKSLIPVDEIPTRTEARTLCWIYAHLILAQLADDFSRDVLDSFPQALADAVRPFVVAADDPDPQCTFGRRAAYRFAADAETTIGRPARPARKPTANTKLAVVYPRQWHLSVHGALPQTHQRTVVL